MINYKEVLEDLIESINSIYSITGSNKNIIELKINTEVTYNDFKIIQVTLFKNDIKITSEYRTILKEDDIDITVNRLCKAILLNVILLETEFEYRIRSGEIKEI